MDTEGSMERAETIDHVWDQIIRGQEGVAADFYGHIAAMRTIHANAHRPEPSPAFARRLREELRRAAPPTAISDDVMRPSPNGHGGGNRLTLLASSRSLPDERPRRLSQLTTAALVVLAIAATLMVFFPGRWGAAPSASDEHLAMIPAVSTPTAETIAVETLLDVVVEDLPAGAGTATLR